MSLSFEEFNKKLNSIYFKLQSIVDEDLVRLSDQIKDLKKQGDPDRSLNKKEAAQALGISISMIDKLRSRGKLPFHNVGRAVRFKQSDINDYISSKKSNGHGNNK